MAKRPNPDDDSLNAAPDDNPGATAFVRLDDAGNLPPPPRAPAPTSGAPKKGLQVQIPDDEPAPPPPKPKVAPPAAKPKGRRGAWWDEKSAGAGDDEEVTAPAEPQEEPEPPADDAPGATAFLKVDEPPPPPRRKGPAPRAEPVEEAPADDGRTQFFKPEQVVLQAEVRQRPAPPPPVETGLPWKQILIALGIATAVTVLSVVIVFREDLFGRSSKKPAKAAVEGSDKAGE